MHIGRIQADRICGAGHDWYARARGRHPRRGLAAHGPDRVGSRPDEDQPRGAHGRGEVFVLRQETVSRVHRVGPALLRDVDQPIDAQVAFTRRARPDRVRLVREADVQRRPIALGIDRDRRYAQLPTSPDDAHRDLAAIGDENFFHVKRVLYFGTAEAVPYEDASASVWRGLIGRLRVGRGFSRAWRRSGRARL